MPDAGAQINDEMFGQGVARNMGDITFAVRRKYTDALLSAVSISFEICTRDGEREKVEAILPLNTLIQIAEQLRPRNEIER